MLKSIFIIFYYIVVPIAISVYIEGFDINKQVYKESLVLEQCASLMRCNQVMVASFTFAVFIYIHFKMNKYKALKISGCARTYRKAGIIDEAFSLILMN